MAHISWACLLIMCIERTWEHKDQQEVNGAAEHGHLHSSQKEKKTEEVGVRILSTLLDFMGR